MCCLYNDYSLVTCFGRSVHVIVMYSFFHLVLFALAFPGSYGFSSGAPAEACDIVSPNTLLLYKHIAHSHTSLPTLTPPSHLTLTPHSPPSHPTLTKTSHSPPSHLTLTPHPHTSPSLPTLTPHPHSSPYTPL